MKKAVRNFVQIVAETLDLKGPIYEFGALQIKGQESISDLRPFFKGKKYFGTDMRPGPGVDKVLDLHNLDLKNSSVETAIVVETLEHVEYPQKAIDEVYRILKPNGVIIVTSPFNFPIHDYPGDFWRYTPQAMKSLLKKFKTVMVYASGDEVAPHTVGAIGFKGKSFGQKKLHRKMLQWQKDWYDYPFDRSKLVLYLTLLTPPIVVRLLSRFKRKMA